MIGGPALATQANWPIISLLLDGRALLSVTLRQVALTLCRTHKKHKCLIQRKTEQNKNMLTCEKHSYKHKSYSQLACSRAWSWPVTLPPVRRMRVLINFSSWELICRERRTPQLVLVQKTNSSNASISKLHTGWQPGNMSVTSGTVVWRGEPSWLSRVDFLIEEVGTLFHRGGITEPLHPGQDGLQVKRSSNGKFISNLTGRRAKWVHSGCHVLILENCRCAEIPINLWIYRGAHLPWFCTRVRNELNEISFLYEICSHVQTGRCATVMFDDVVDGCATDPFHYVLSTVMILAVMIYYVLWCLF